jgi:hypothetical protein
MGAAPEQEEQASHPAVHTSHPASLVGMQFVWVTPGPKTLGRFELRTGVVKGRIGVDGWLLEFQAIGYRFCNVLSTEQLEPLAFFTSAAERQAFLEHMLPESQVATLHVQSLL